MIKLSRLSNKQIDKLFERCEGNLIPEEAVQAQLDTDTVEANRQHLEELAKIKKEWEESYPDILAVVGWQSLWARYGVE